MTRSTIGILYTISEGSQSESPSISPQSAESISSTYDMEHETKIPRSVIHDNGSFGKGKSHPRLAQLRGQIRAQIREHSPRNQMIELVDKVTYAQSANKTVEGEKFNESQESNKMCSCSNPACFSSELEGRLHVELTALRLEMKSTLEAIKAELTQELQTLHQEVKVCCHHCPHKDSDSSHTPERRQEWKNVFKKVNRKEEQDAQSPVKLNGQIKARSLQSLVSQSGPSRNQVLLKAVTTIAAKNALVSNLGIRSDSDPTPQTNGKQSTKHVPKNDEPPNHLYSNGNWGKKIMHRTVAPLPQNGILPNKGH
ncbi:protein FAM246C [Gastrophryne carolinensis]